MQESSGISRLAPKFSLQPITDSGLRGRGLHLGGCVHRGECMELRGWSWWWWWRGGDVGAQTRMKVLVTDWPNWQKVSKLNFARSLKVANNQECPL